MSFEKIVPFSEEDKKREEAQDGMSEEVKLMEYERLEASVEVRWEELMAARKKFRRFCREHPDLCKHVWRRYSMGKDACRFCNTPRFPDEPDWDVVEPGICVVL